VSEPPRRSTERAVRIRAWLSAVVLFAACGNSPPAAAGPAGDGPDPAVEANRERAVAAIDSVVNDVIATGRVPGVAVAVIAGTDTLVLRGYGHADPMEGMSMTAGTLLPIGSLVKQFTAAAILRLAERNELRLDDSVRKFVPRFPGEWQAVTLHHLLSHTSGVPRALAQGWQDRERSTREDMLRELSERGPFEFDPGTRWAYNNAGYVVLALIIEAVTGEGYHEHVRRTFLEPLGMRFTMDSDSLPATLPRATGSDTARSRLIARAAPGFPAALGSGFYHSTVGDMVAWQRALRSGRVVGAGTWARMTAPASLDGGEDWPYGYALWLRDLDGRPRAGHGGSQAGFRSYMGYLPDEDLSVVVLINSGAVDSWAVGESILRAALRAQADGKGQGDE
jgi:D-alanyl-D-alanine carboxypeptidase